MALFIFLVPQGTIGQELFISPLYQSLRQVIARRCNCEFAIFNGNTLTQQCMSGPNSVSCRTRLGRCNSNLAPCSYGDVESSNLLLALSDTYEQLLLARGNWLVQVYYQTEPSCHHLFMRLVANYGTQLSDAGLRRAGLSRPINQGFKYTTLAAVTHEKLRMLISNHYYVQGEERTKEREKHPYTHQSSESIKKTSRNITTQTKGLHHRSTPSPIELQKNIFSDFQKADEEILDSETQTTTSMEMYTRIPVRNNASSRMMDQEKYINTQMSRMSCIGPQQPRIRMIFSPDKIEQNNGQKRKNMVKGKEASGLEYCPAVQRCDTLASESSVQLVSSTSNTGTSDV